MSACFRNMVLSLGLCAVASAANAAEWKHEIAPYVWGSSMQGTVGVGALTAETDMSFSDILDNLEFGFMGTYRASTDRYSITVDAIYMGLGVTGQAGAGRDSLWSNAATAAASTGRPTELRFRRLSCCRSTQGDRPCQCPARYE